MASRSAGVSGTAVLLGATGIYLAYTGIKDVPLIDGARSLLRGQRPQESAGDPYEGPDVESLGVAAGTVGAARAGGGDLGLVGFAALALPILRARFPNLEMGGRADRPDNLTSDHPHGKAIDVMTTDRATHQAIVNTARGLIGLKYWCSDLIPGGANCPGNRHRDHVHLSFR